MRFFKLFFSKFLFVFIAICFQIFVFIATNFYLSSTFWWVNYWFSFLAFIIFLAIINKDKPASFKLPWVAIVLFVPIVGIAIYILFGNYTLSRKARKAIKKEDKKLIRFCKKNKETMDKLYIENKKAYGQACYIERTCFLPTYENCYNEFLPTGEDFFKSLVENLKTAKKYIFMEYFIIGEGYVWDTVLEVLRKKVKEGVEVRLMYDGTCSISLLPYEYPKQLREYGIQCKEFGPIVPILSTSQNNRDHRKICVIDGKVAFTGGVNLADEYINKKVRFGHWKDTAIKIEGDAVQSFTMMFLQMWNITERQPEDYAKYLTEKQPGFSRKDGYIIPYGDSPFDHENVGEEVYFHILNHAKKYVHIMTPYLILDNEMIDALTRAAKGGIEVQIIMPHIPDKPYAFYLAKTYYEELIAGGVEIYEYTPGFVHAKVFTSDDDTATVGSINLDYRSLYLHFECGVFIYRNPVVRDIEKDFQETLAKCQKVTMTEVRNRSTFVKIYGQVLRIVAPLM